MEKLKRQFVEMFQISPEIALDLPLMMLIGEERLELENHKGVSQFHREEIKVKVKKGYMLIKGNKLSIDEINSESISITGIISSISYEKKGESL
ncbi:YabP/YqfC family sporulation protein [Natronospora cellulosivora (SeqCode)]